MTRLGLRLRVARDADQVRAHREAEALAFKQAATRAQAAKQRALRRKRTASWANPEIIVTFYRRAALLTRQTGIPHEVDHIVPLLGKLVSGPHVEDNLQVVPRAANRAKSNHYTPDEVVGGAGIEPATSTV